MDDTHPELVAIVSAVRAHLEAEQELKSPGLRVPGGPEGLGKTQAFDAGSVPASSAPPKKPSAPAVIPTPEAQAEAAPAARRDSSDKHRQLAQLAEDAATCTACVLHERRTHSVFARGNPDAELAFVGEGPGYEEDMQGLPFVGPAGQLLDRMIAAMGFGRDEVYVCNIVKCRPPENRTPRPEEAIACARFLRPQLELVRPKMIVALGRCAAENLGVAGAAGPWRGRLGAWQGIPVMPTYHPAYLLRSPEQKRVVWDDLQQVMARLGRTRPVRPS